MYQGFDARTMMSEAKFYSDYSRYIEQEDRYEEWSESVDRVMNMHRGFYAEKENEELKSYYELIENQYRDKRILGAQRALQFGGEQLLKKHMKMYNCTSSYADRPAFFGEFFWVQLCGAGVGFSVQKHHVAMLPKIQKRKGQLKTYLIEDSIEGWANAVNVLMSSYFVSDQKFPEFAGRRVFFDLSLIRPKGSEISGGFKAPGPEGLRMCLDKIEHFLQSLVIDAAEPVALRPIHVYDIAMYTADAVLSGGIRRSASICLFSPDDTEMMNAKTGDWYIKNPQRGRSNNSVVIVRKEATREMFANIMKSVKEFGEPGFVFVESTEHLGNPCFEIGMLPKFEGKSGWQGCNLAEINGALCTTEEEFYRACEAASAMCTLQAGYTKFDYLGEISEKIFERESLIGVSITGWMNSPEILFNENVLKEGARIVKETNARIAAIIGINAAARTCCVKPSGNASTVLGTASGIHPEHSARYIRNVQFNKELDVAKLIKKVNPHMIEESFWSETKSDYVASFPIVTVPGSLYKNDIMGVKHLELVKLAQQAWVVEGKNPELCVDPDLNHNVSNTITVDDWDEVENYLFENKAFFSGVSFLAKSGDKDYVQAPFTEVLTSDQIVEKYGTGSLFASGLIVDAVKAFNGNLWNACYYGQSNDDTFALESAENFLAKDWIRRFKNFARNYFDGDEKQAEYCLKDVYVLHKWEKITNNMVPIENWSQSLPKKDFVDVTSLAGQACAGGMCDISLDL